MIIEAAPRLRDETTGTYSPSPNTQHRRKQFSTNPSDNKGYQALAKISECTAKEAFKNWAKSASDLPGSGRLNRIRDRKILHRRHPYRKEDKEKQSVNSVNFVWSALNCRKCSSWVRSHNRDKVSEFLHKFVPNQHQKKGRTGNKLPYFPFPVFTANVNENNDNCPGTTHNPYEIAVATQLSTSTIQTEDNCDVEIEDLTEDDEQKKQDSKAWRQRRRSFNTNPLSASSFRSEKSPFSLYLDEVLSKNTFSKGELSRRVVSEKLLKEHYFAKGRQSQTTEFLHTKEASDIPAPTIDKLVEFFESNSNLVLPRVDHRNSQKLQQEHLSESRGHNQFDIFERRGLFRDQSSCCQRERSCNPNHSRCRQEISDSVVTEFSSPVAQKDLESVFRISGRHIPRGVISTSGCVHNNNGNAASTTPKSCLFWPENEFIAEHHYPCSSAVQQNTSTTSRSGIVSSDCRPFSSSVGRLSPDIGLDNLNTSRVFTLPNIRPRTSPTGSCITGTPLHLDNLIDLQTTSTRSGNWRGGKDPARKSEETNRLKLNFNVIQSPRKGDKGGERIESGSFPVQRKENESGSLSANNHHNAPWFSSEDSIPLKDRNQEKHFPFEHLQLHRSLLNHFIEKRPFSFWNCDRVEMGCIQSIAKSKVSPDRCSHGIIVKDIEAAIDKTPTEIEEKSPIVLRYRTPYFRASAHVIVPPIPRKEIWTVGWIQACDSMKFINQYGKLGSSSWEIPALKDRRITAVSDSDGVSYPWYGNTTEIATVEGPTETSHCLKLQMNDNFYPSVTWDIPVSEGSEAHLTHIVRDQSFTTWLAAVNQTTGRLEVLRTVKWHFYLEIDVDPTQELGRRARIASPLEQKQPIVLKNNSEPIYISSPQRGNSNGSASRQKRFTNRRPGAGGDNNSNNHTNYIPKSALVRPSANNAQTLIWRPNRDIPVIVVPAKEEYKENNEVVWFTRAQNVQDDNVRELSLQEMSQLKKSSS